MNTYFLRKVCRNVVTDDCWVPDSLDRSRRVTLLSLFTRFPISLESLAAAKNQLGEPRNPSSFFVDLMSDMQGKRVLGIHIRRGDYVRLKHLYGEISSRWYSEQAQTLLDFHERVLVLTDSDEKDPVLTEALSKTEHKIIGPGELESPVETLALLSSCTSLILSNSSISWWATALGEKLETVIYPIVDEGLKSPFHDVSIHNLSSANLVGRKIF